MTAQDTDPSRRDDELAALRQQVAALETALAEQRRETELLRQNEQRFRALAEEGAKHRAMLEATVECLPFDFFAIGADGCYMFENAACRSHWGRLVGKKPDDLAPTAELRQLWLENNRRALAGERVEGEVRLSVGGQERTVHNVVTPIRDETHFYGVLGVNIDITAQKQAEAVLQRARDELEREVQQRTAELVVFRWFAEASGRGFGMADLDGRIVYANPTLYRLFGETCVEDVLGKHVETYYPAEYRRKRLEEIRPAVMRDGSWQGEQEVLARDGTLIPTYQVSFLIRDESGAPFRLAVCVADIRQHKQAEEDLRKSEEKYRRLVEASPDGVIVIDLQRRVTFVSPRMLQLHGTDREQDLLGRDALDFVVADDREKFITHFRQTLEMGVSLNVELLVYKHDGTQFPVEISAATKVDAHGQPTALMAVLRDITERRQAQEALQQAHDELRTIYDQMIEGLLITDIETKHFVRANASICRMLGYSEAELLTAAVEDIHPPEEVPNDVQRFQAAAAGHVSINENRPVLRKDGNIFYADISGHRIRYQGRPCLLALFRDVTERRQAQEALRQSREELQAIYDQVTDGILIADTESFTAVRTNTAFWRMLGYTTDEAFVITPERIHPPEVLPRVYEYLDIARRGGFVRISDLPFLRKDGQLAYADVVTSPISYNGRNGWVSFFHDVTERRHARLALERERQTLEYMLQSSDHERQLIAYEIHDGLAQQLAGAIMQFEVYDHLKATKPTQAADAYHAATTMMRQAHYEARRLIAGVRPPILDESGVVAAIAHLVYEPVFDRGPQVEFRSRVKFTRLAPVLENVVYRIVQEGLTNARQYSLSDRVVVSLIQRGDRLRIEIRDWGVGFDTKAPTKGHFGLEGIRQRARLLGGKCSIRSQPGKGTAVIVGLPVIEQKPDE